MKSFKILIQYFCINKYKLTNFITSLGILTTSWNFVIPISDSFKFVSKNRRTTNATDMLIVDAYRNLAESSASISKRFHVSDTYAHDVFDRYVKLDRLPESHTLKLVPLFSPSRRALNNYAIFMPNPHERPSTTLIIFFEFPYSLLQKIRTTGGAFVFPVRLSIINIT